MSLALWGGIECTVNRVGDRWLDQRARTAGAAHAQQLDEVVALGVSHLRYPALWEHVARDGEAAWARIEADCARLRDGGVTPILGLVHHGSGPPGTSLVDEGFVDGLAAHADAVAARHPWLRYVTPVNEPLTTARFAGLYGIWYPHGRDDRTFIRALLVQCLATRAAMHRLRQRLPDVQLVQTEDIGATYATRPLAYQAEFDNARRWLSLDLLCGRVDASHPLRAYLEAHGASPGALDSLVDDPCPPDIIGVNHYVTSERWLDHRRHRYPSCTHGGNGRHHYADVEAVRVRTAGIGGPGVALLETWERYHRPVAITEAHLGGTRDEQLRWLRDTWRDAQEVRARGADVRAVTVWSLLGAYDWDSLVTRDAGRYEPGVFDLRGGQPRRTALADLVATIARGDDYDHPALDGDGWWRRPIRLLYPPTRSRVEGIARPSLPRHRPRPSPRPVLITGGAGTLGAAIARLCDLRGLAHRSCTHRELDVTDADAVRAMLQVLRPWAVINAAGYGCIDRAEREPEACAHTYLVGSSVLAEACAASGLPLVTFSSDLVFGGEASSPYVESHARSPLSVLGASQAAAEDAVRQRHADALVIRTSACFGPWDVDDFVHQAVRALAAGRAFRAAMDVRVSPTYVPDLVMAALDLLIDGERGVWHLANGGETTWADFAQAAAEAAGVDAAPLVPVPVEDLGLPAPRPTYSVLGSERAQLLPPLDEALARWHMDGR